jgi:transketolase
MTTESLAKKIRISVLRMVHRANSSHIGSCLSIADIMAVLYEKILKVNPQKSDWPDRDRFLLSKGHAAAILYAVLAERGFFPLEWLDNYGINSSPLITHTSHMVPGIELSTGSLGHALPVGCGMALAAKRSSKNYRVFVLLGDGELDEGSNWEAILFASHHKLDNLTAIVDYNKLQGFGAVEQIIRLEPLTDKWTSFGWSVIEIDGHNHQQISDKLRKVPLEKNRPTVIIANTIKGKGVSFMENKFEWHYKSPNDEQLQMALKELEQFGNNK